MAELGLVSIVNLADVVSHLKTGSYAHLWQRGLSGADYQLDLRCSFLHFGLPLRISLIMRVPSTTIPVCRPFRRA